MEVHCLSEEPLQLEKRGEDIAGLPEALQKLCV